MKIAGAGGDTLHRARLRLFSDNRVIIIRTPLSRCGLGFFAPALVLSLSGLSSALLALAHEATLAAKVAQKTRFLDVFRKTLQEGIKTLTIA